MAVCLDRMPVAPAGLTIKIIREQWIDKTAKSELIVHQERQ